MAKKNKTKKDLYLSNQRKAKVLKILAPFVFWGFIALSIMCLIFAVKNSFGNIAEITSLLDNSIYTGEELSNNYAYLVEKYGEWIIGTGGAGFTITFINIGNALFSGLMMLNLTLAIMFFVGAFLLGKWLMPLISNQITQSNQDMVNMEILKKT